MMKSEGHAEVVLPLTRHSKEMVSYHEQGRTHPDDTGLEELALPLAWWGNPSGLD